LAFSSSLSTGLFFNVDMLMFETQHSPRKQVVRQWRRLHDLISSLLRPRPTHEALGPLFEKFRQQGCDPYSGRKQLTQDVILKFSLTSSSIRPETRR
jgi:hypothetical protein